MEEIERLPKGVENILMDTVRKLLRGDESDMTFIKLLITISKLRIFSKFLYDAIYERIAQRNKAEEQKKAFEKYLQSEGWLYSLSQYWREVINSAIEGRIEDRELAEMFLNASLDLMNAKAVIREEIEKAFKEGKIDRRFFYLIADAAENAPPDAGMLLFAYNYFKKAEHVEAPGKDIARLSLAAHFFSLGYALYELKNFKNSIIAYSISLELNPDNANAYINRGIAYAKQQKYNEAIKDYNKAIELNPDLTEAYNNRGNAYAKLGEYNRAIEDYNKAVELNPDLVGAYNNRGLAYAELGEYDRAIKDYNKAIELNPDLAEAYYNRGNTYLELHEYAKAIEDFNKAIELNKDYAEAYNNRGVVYAKQQKYDKAIEDFNKAIELNPDDAEAYGNRGIAYAKQQKYNEAIKDFNKVIESNPNDAKAYYNRGLTYAELGEYDRAKEDMLRAGNLFTNKRKIEYAIRVCEVIFNIGEESERVIAGHILLLHSYISGRDSANDIMERLNEMGYMDEEVLRNAIERLERREESKWLILIFSALLHAYNRMRERRENHH